MTTNRHRRDWQRRRRRALPAPLHRLQGAGRARARASSRARDNIYLWDSDGQQHPRRDVAACGASTSATASSALIDAATRQLETLPFYNAFFQTATPPAIELAELLAEVTPPQFKHVFFAGSGSEGNDTVVRMVRRYWDLLGQPRAPGHHQPPQRATTARRWPARRSAA